VEFLRNYHRNNLDYREAIDLELVNGSKTPYIDRLSEMSYDQVKAEAVRAGVRVVEGDSKEKLILEVLRNKKEV
jgi:beta-lactam-binding protein with PASTA domain